MALRTDWADNAGQSVDAAYLNALGTQVNANTTAIGGAVRTGVYQFEQTTGATALGAAGTVVLRRRCCIPQKVIQWRLHLRNIAFLTNTNATGSLTGVQANYGQAAISPTTGGVTGATKTAPTALTLSGSTLTGGNELVSNWVTPNPTIPLIGRQIHTYIGVQFTTGSGDQVSFGGGEQWYSTNAADFATAAPTGFTRVSSQAFLNMYIEYQFADDTSQIVFNVGNSLSGGGNGASPNYDNRGELDAWGGQWAVRNNGVLPSIAVAGAWAANFTATDAKWNYYSTLANPLVPDVVTFVALNSSDLIGSGSWASSNLTNAQSNMTAAMLRARALFPSARLIVTNNPPRISSTGSGTASSTLENDRLVNNKWLESAPCGSETCVDIDKIATDWGNPARLRPVYDPGDGTHGRPRYYSEMATAIGDAIGPRRLVAA